MTQRVQDKGKIARIGARAGQKESLPYRIELRDLADDKAVVQLLARAFSGPLARAIFKAAQVEHPDRRITLSRGNRVLADSAK